MALTFGEVAQIDQRLASDGRSASAADVENLLKEVESWFRRPTADGRKIFDSKTLTELSTIAQKHEDDHSRAIAIGALMLACREGERYPDRVRFALKFATERIAALAGSSPLWRGIRLSPEEEADARALFDVARGDTSYTDADLAEAVEVFVRDYARDGGLFGALAADLSYLGECVRDPAFDAAKKEVARAALTYFAVVSDAIPDDLGFVGFLDDAFVVTHAMEEIRPERARLNALLEDVVQRWPFVRDVVLEAGGGERPLSEFILVNAALLLDEVCTRDDSSGTALVVPEAGPLPFLIGFVRALHEATRNCSAGASNEFVKGERLANRETGAEVIFDSYGNGSTSGGWEPRPAVEATHFRFVVPASRRGSVVTQTRQLTDIRSFARSTKRQGNLRRGSVTFARDRVGVGPLERLTGAIDPAVLPARSGVVIVVAPLGATRALASELSLYGTPLVDVLPIQQAAVHDSAIETRAWSAHAPGGAPMMTVVKSTADAAAIIDEADHDVVAVVAPVRPQTTDATNLARIARHGVPVIGLVREFDVDTHEHLASEGFGFWGWDERWFGALRWPADDATVRDHPIGRFEAAMRWHLHARPSIEVLDLQELTELHRRLAEFSSTVTENAPDTILEFSTQAWALFVTLCRTVTPLDESRFRELERRSDALVAAVLDAETWWDDPTMETAKNACGAFGPALAAIRRGNPKWAALLSWSRRNPSGVVITKEEMRADLSSARESAHLSCVDAAAFRGPVGHALLPAWFGADRMRRLLFAPGVEHLTMLLHRAELEWYEALLRKRSACMLHVRRLVQTRGPFPKLRLADEESFETAESAAPIPDDIVHGVRHARALRALRDGGTDRVDGRLVHFSGGLWAAFLPSHPVQTATHLIERIDDFGPAAELRDVAAADLEVGDHVLLLRGSNRDALREAVDAEAPVGTRATASEWKRALRRWVESGRSAEEVAAGLAGLDCRRTSVTVRRWLEDELMIGPRDEDIDVAAIAKLTGDRVLAGAEAECVAAIRLLRGLHLKMAHRLADQVVSAIRERMRAGLFADDLVAIDDRFVLVVVEGIAPEPVSVARGKINRLYGED
jgi:uncharacterized membrane protein YkvA (DUF1232 family)